jgi:asparagine synthase (glutamine-hydrolysing)
MSMLAADAGAAVLQPFEEPSFVRAVVAAAPRDGFPSRTHALRHLVGDLLPEQLLPRSTKAGFTQILWGPASRAFAASWDGTGLDQELIDVDGLRKEWSKEHYPDLRAMPAFQAAWLAAQS